MTDMITEIQISQIAPGPNDRTTFDLGSLCDLADSIREHGLLMAIIVRSIYKCGSADCGIAVYPARPDCPACGAVVVIDHYEIIAGERRWRACGLAGLATVPSVICDSSDEEASELMLIENVNRADLDPVDEGLAYLSRMERFGWTVAQVADKAHVSTMRVQLRIKVVRNLRADLLPLVRSGNLQLGYAQILADAGLDSNRQSLAVSRLRDYHHPTPGWFRGVCASLLGEQAQGDLFGLPILTGDVASAAPQPAQPVDPPHPATTKPPKHGRTPAKIIENQAEFWELAAQEWSKIGKPFRRQECQAAAQALKQAALLV